MRPPSLTPQLCFSNTVGVSRARPWCQPFCHAICQPFHRNLFLNLANLFELTKSGSARSPQRIRRRGTSGTLAGRLEGLVQASVSSQPDRPPRLHPAAKHLLLSASSFTAFRLRSIGLLRLLCNDGKESFTSSATAVRGGNYKHAHATRMRGCSEGGDRTGSRKSCESGGCIKTCGRTSEREGSGNSRRGTYGARACEGTGGGGRGKGDIG
jgi:hypothetical protein